MEALVYAGMAEVAEEAKDEKHEKLVSKAGGVFGPFIVKVFGLSMYRLRQLKNISLQTTSKSRASEFAAFKQSPTTINYQTKVL